MSRPSNRPLPENSTLPRRRFLQAMTAALPMDAQVTATSDFGFKARLIRLRLDDDLDVETEARKLADQMIAFWTSATNLEVSNSIF